MLVFSLAGAPLSIFQDATRAVNLLYCRSPGQDRKQEESLHSWVKVDQAGRPLPPKRLSIFEGLTVKLIPHTVL